MTARKNIRKSGFTLIEIMVVMAILGLLIGMAAYTYLSQLNQIRLRADSREVDQALQLAKMRAIASGRDHGVVFNLEDGRYFVFVDCAGDGSTVPDQKYSGTTTAHFNNNASVGTWDACDAADYDPRVSDRAILHLETTTYFEEAFGAKRISADKVGYVVFNHLGQAIQGPSNFVDTGNPIILRTDIDGKQSEIRILVTGGTGVSDILPMRWAN